MSPSVSVRLLLTQSDARLVGLAREGHERAFEALVQRYRRPLLNYCRRLLPRDERAEDVLQQGLLQAWLALQDGYTVREAKPWLYRIVHNCALNALRASGYDHNTLSESLRGAEAPEHDLDRRIAVREALGGLAALPNLQREALMRTAIDGHSHDQVARSLGLSEGALRGLVYRARASLRAATTALTPSPVVSWALAPRPGTSAPLLARLAETGAGGGSVGLGGMLVKGGAIAVTAGALAGGIVATNRAMIRPHPRPSSSGGASRVLLAQAHDALPAASSDARPATRASQDAAQAHERRGSPVAIQAPHRQPQARSRPRQIEPAGPGTRALPPGAPGMTRDSSHDPTRSPEDHTSGEQQQSSASVSEGSGSSKDEAGSGASNSGKDSGSSGSDSSDSHDSPAESPSDTSTSGASGAEAPSITW